jgi:hypothetical protein
MSGRDVPAADEEIALLRRISEQLEALPAAIAAAISAAIELQGRAPRRLSSVDEMLLKKLLPMIWAAVGDREFTVNELIQRFHLEIESTRKVGRLLARAVNVDLAGYRVSSIGAGREGVYWRVIKLAKTRFGG